MFNIILKIYKKKPKLSILYLKIILFADVVEDIILNEFLCSESSKYSA